MRSVALSLANGERWKFSLLVLNLYAVHVSFAGRKQVLFEWLFLSILELILWIGIVKCRIPNRSKIVCFMLESHYSAMDFSSCSRHGRLYITDCPVVASVLYSFILWNRRFKKKDSSFGNKRLAVTCFYNAGLRRFVCNWKKCERLRKPKFGKKGEKILHFSYYFRICFSLEHDFFQALPLCVPVVFPLQSQ